MKKKNSKLSGFYLGLIFVPEKSRQDGMVDAP